MKTKYFYYYLYEIKSFYFDQWSKKESCVIFTQTWTLDQMLNIYILTVKYDKWECLSMIYLTGQIFQCLFNILLIDKL